MNQMLKDLLPLLTTIGALAAIVHHFVVIVGKSHEFQRKQMYLLSLEISTLAASIRQIREELAEGKIMNREKEDLCRKTNWQQA